MNIKINSTFISIATALIIQLSGVIYFVSSLSNHIDNNTNRLHKAELSISSISSAIEALDKSVTLMNDQQKNINSDHKILFEKTNLYDGVYVPAERRQYD